MHVERECADMFELGLCIRMCCAHSLVCPVEGRKQIAGPLCSSRPSDRARFEPIAAMLHVRRVRVQSAASEDASLRSLAPTLPLLALRPTSPCPLGASQPQLFHPRRRQPRSLASSLLLLCLLALLLLLGSVCAQDESSSSSSSAADGLYGDESSSSGDNDEWMDSSSSSGGNNFLASSSTGDTGSLGDLHSSSSSGAGGNSSGRSTSSSSSGGHGPFDAVPEYVTDSALWPLPPAGTVRMRLVFAVPALPAYAQASDAELAASELEGDLSPVSASFLPLLSAEVPAWLTLLRKDYEGSPGATPFSGAIFAREPFFALPRASADLSRVTVLVDLMDAPPPAEFDARRAYVRCRLDYADPSSTHRFRGMPLLSHLTSVQQLCVPAGGVGANPYANTTVSFALTCPDTPARETRSPTFERALLAGGLLLLVQTLGLGFCAFHKQRLMQVDPKQAAKLEAQRAQRAAWIEARAKAKAEAERAQGAAGLEAPPLTGRVAQEPQGDAALLLAETDASNMVIPMRGEDDYEMNTAEDDEEDDDPTSSARGSHGRALLHGQQQRGSEIMAGGSGPLFQLPLTNRLSLNGGPLYVEPASPSVSRGTTPSTNRRVYTQSVSGAGMLSSPSSSTNFHGGIASPSAAHMHGRAGSTGTQLAPVSEREEVSQVRRGDEDGDSRSRTTVSAMVPASRPPQQAQVSHAQGQQMAGGKPMAAFAPPVPAHPAAAFAAGAAGARVAQRPLAPASSVSQQQSQVAAAVPAAYTPVRPSVAPAQPMAAGVARVTPATATASPATQSRPIVSMASAGAQPSGASNFAAGVVRGAPVQPSPLLAAGTAVAGSPARTLLPTPPSYAEALAAQQRHSGTVAVHAQATSAAPPQASRPARAAVVRQMDDDDE